MRKLNLLIAAAAPAIVIAMLTAAPARADVTPECNVNAGPDGISGNADEGSGSTECGEVSVASGLVSTAVGSNSSATG